AICHVPPASRRQVFWRAQTRMSTFSKVERSSRSVRTNHVERSSRSVQTHFAERTEQELRSTNTMAKMLESKVIVIVGGTTGLGLSAAQACIAAGARIVCVGRSESSVKAAQKTLGASARVIAGDAADPKTAPRAIATALKEFGGFQGLYH